MVLKEAAPLERKLINLLLTGKLTCSYPLADAVRDDISKMQLVVNPEKIQTLENIDMTYDRFANAAVTKSQAKQLLGFSEGDLFVRNYRKACSHQRLTYLIDAFVKAKRVVCQLLIWQ